MCLSSSMSKLQQPSGSSSGKITPGAGNIKASSKNDPYQLGHIVEESSLPRGWIATWHCNEVLLLRVPVDFQETHFVPYLYDMSYCTVWLGGAQFDNNPTKCHIGKTVKNLTTETLNDYCNCLKHETV